MADLRHKHDASNLYSPATSCLGRSPVQMQSDSRKGYVLDKPSNIDNVEECRDFALGFVYLT